MKRKKILNKASIFAVIALLFLSTIIVNANIQNKETQSYKSCILKPDKINKKQIVSDSNFKKTGLIWDNGIVDEENALCCQSGGVINQSDLVDDFHTTKFFTLTKIVWETVDDYSYTWDNTTDLIIYEFTPNGPGAIIKNVNAITASRIYIDELFSRPHFEYTIDLVSEGSEINLPPGDYFILLRPVSDNTSGQSFWLTSPGNPNNQSSVYFRSDFFGFPDWTNSTTTWGIHYDVNFKIFGHLTKPELEIGPISGGFGLSTTIKNNGPTIAEDVTWDIKFDGGIVFSPAGGISSGGPVDLAPGGVKNISIIPFGFGGLILPMEITISTKANNADEVNTTTPARLFMIFVNI